MLIHRGGARGMLLSSWEYQRFWWEKKYVHISKIQPSPRRQGQVHRHSPANVSLLAMAVSHADSLCLSRSPLPLPYSVVPFFPPVPESRRHLVTELLRETPTYSAARLLLASSTPTALPVLTGSPRRPLPPSLAVPLRPAARPPAAGARPTAAALHAPNH